MTGTAPVAGPPVFLPPARVKRSALLSGAWRASPC